MPRDEHVRTCPAADGKPECRCGLVHLQLYGREALAQDVIEWARSVRRSWEQVAPLAEKLAKSLNSGNVLLHHDIEQLVRAIVLFDTAP